MITVSANDDFVFVTMRSGQPDGGGIKCRLEIGDDEKTKREQSDEPPDTSDLNWGNPVRVRPES